MLNSKNLGLFIIGLFIIFSNSAYSQPGEFEGRLNYRYTKKAQQQNMGNRRRNPPKTIILPFFDDFFDLQTRPNAQLWQNDYTLVNRTSPFNPPSAGVATFDGLNEFGRAYAPGSQGSRSSDTLTSQLIDISTLSDKDSLYISFLYQGRGLNDDDPDPSDSLVLEFKPDSVKGSANRPYDSFKWIKVWAIDGRNSNKPFKLAMIPIKNLPDSANYFHKKFTFRFRNLASPSGLLDPWHIDYVYVNRGRNKFDTSFNDVAMSYASGSILNKYYSMPYEHVLFDSSKWLSKKINIYVKNNFSQTRNVRYGYKIFNLNNNVLLSAGSSVVDENVLPYSTSNLALNRGSLQFSIRNNLVRWRVQTFAFNQASTFVRTNDSINHIQTFSTYYAYDDNSAEASYYLNGVSKMRAAVKFELAKPDTLYGVGIHFTEEGVDQRQQIFDVAVWKKINAVGQMAFEEPDASVNFTKQMFVDSANGFAYYPLEKPLAITNQVYIGWIQNSNFRLNIGFDKNYYLLNGNQANPNLFFSVDGFWSKTSLKGAPMIRMYSITKPNFTGIKSNDQAKRKISIYPNPATHHITVNTQGYLAKSIEIRSFTGQIVAASQNNYNHASQFDVSEFPAGIYLVTVTTSEGIAINQKFVKN